MPPFFSNFVHNVESFNKLNTCRLQCILVVYSIFEDEMNFSFPWIAFLLLYLHLKINGSRHPIGQLNNFYILSHRFEVKTIQNGEKSESWSMLILIMKKIITSPVPQNQHCLASFCMDVNFQSIVIWSSFIFWDYRLSIEIVTKYFTST